LLDARADHGPGLDRATPDFGACQAGCSQCSGAQLCEDMVQAFRAQQHNMQSWLDSWALVQSEQLEQHQELMKTFVQERTQSQLPDVESSIDNLLGPRFAALEASMRQQHDDALALLTEVAERVLQEQANEDQNIQLEEFLIRERTHLAQEVQKMLDARFIESQSIHTQGSHQRLPHSSLHMPHSSVPPPAKNLEEKKDDCFLACVPGAVSPDATSPRPVAAQKGQQQNEFASEQAGDDTRSEGKWLRPQKSTNTAGVPVWLQDDVPNMEDVKAALGWAKTFPSHASERISGPQRCERSSNSPRLKRIVKSAWFDLLAFVVVLAASVLVGIDAHLSMSAVFAEKEGRVYDARPVWFEIAQIVILALFAAEILLRIGATECEFFLGKSWFWNWMDLALLVAFLLDMVLSDSSSYFVRIRILRVFRLSGMLRVVKGWKQVSELRWMLLAVSRSLFPLTLILGVIAMVTYIFAIILMSLSVEQLRAIPKGEQQDAVASMKELFGSLPAAVLTLTSVVSGGQPWRAVGAIVSDTSVVAAMLLGVYMLAMIVCVMNVITGILLWNVQEVAELDAQKSRLTAFEREDGEANKMKRLLSEVSDEPGVLTSEVLHDQMSSKEVRAFLKWAEIDAAQAWGMYHILNKRGTNRVGIDEFLVGCMRLHGSARNVDACTLMSENKRMVEAWAPSLQYIGEKLDHMQAHLSSLQMFVPDSSVMCGDGSSAQEPPRASSAASSQAS